MDKAAAINVAVVRGEVACRALRLWGQQEREGKQRGWQRTEPRGMLVFEMAEWKGTDKGMVKEGHTSRRRPREGVNDQRCWTLLMGHVSWALRSDLWMWLLVSQKSPASLTRAVWMAVKPPSKKGQKKMGGKKLKYGTLKKCIVKWCFGERVVTGGGMWSERFF